MHCSAIRLCGTTIINYVCLLYVDLSKQQYYHAITSVKQLNLMLEDIGNWEALCLNLGVRTGVIDGLRHSRLPVSSMKLQCIEAYVNDGDATWEEVRTAVTLYPILNSNVASKIARKYL